MKLLLTIHVSNTAIILGMRKRFFILILAAILLTACGAGTAENGIEVHKVKMGAGAQGEDRAVYLAMHNHGSGTDQLTGASSDAAEVVQLQNGTEVVDVIPVYANTEFVFIPDGYHVMLVGLKQDLHVGDEIEVVLQFRDHVDMTISVPVGEATEHEHDH
ncbi:MAG TPA: copper chaperone PCu(A)C [Anaerolineales bacterium]|nr:copper chaperone PCu(A)C [Anaerolineales bacterium]